MNFVAKKFVIALLLAAAVGVPTAEAKKEKQPVMTPMELQAIQSKEFETSKENLFGAVMTVTQDLGYQIQSADLQTGFITAISATEQKTNFFEALGGGRSTAVTKMTAFIQMMPNKMARVRLNFLVSKTMSSAYGQTNQNDKPILDVTVYRNAWDKIDEALFVMGALEAPKPATPIPPVTTASQQGTQSSDQNSGGVSGEASKASNPQP